MRVGMVSVGDGPVLAVERDGRWYRWTPPTEAPAGSGWSAVDDLRQEANLGEMISGVAETIGAISRVFPLEPGDLIAMGTPGGAGVGFDPPQYLQDGDRVVCEIDGIGRLDNEISFV